MAKISLKEARALILSGEVFDMQWTTADEHRQKGGVRVTETNLQLCGSSHSDKKNVTFTVKSINKKLANPVTVHWDLVEKINGLDVDIDNG